MKTFFNKRKRVLVGLSGGVDSAVCAFVLKKRGFDVVGVHFSMAQKKSFSRAKKIAKRLEIPFFVKDISSQFHGEVVKNFINEYYEGRTPNPCVLCNEKVKYANLLDIADKKGFDYVSTGHYARIIPVDGFYFLQKAKDAKKDQTYFLYRLGQRQLSRILLPLGEMEKEDVKKIAREENLPVEKNESQDICFFAKQENLEIFLKNRIGKKKGRIMNEKGEFLGWHEGSNLFTLGQRHGLKLGGGGPFYVYGKDKKENTLSVVADRKSPLLFSREVFFRDVCWNCALPEKDKQYLIKTRYQGKESTGVVLDLQKKELWKAVTEDPQRAVAEGQSIVIYDGKKLVGGGIICGKNSNNTGKDQSVL